MGMSSFGVALPSVWSVFAGAAGRPFRLLAAVAALLLACAGLVSDAVGQPAGAGASSASGGGSVPAPVVVPAARFAKNVAVITIDTGDGMIDWVTAKSVVRRIADAEKGGAQAIVFEIHTNGGEMGAMLEISEAIKKSPVANTVAWINTRAYSAGAIIALACREIVVAPTAVMGDAAPVLGGPMGMQTLGPTERAKILAPMLVEVVDSARRNGYDEKLVQGFLALGIKLWLVENTQTGETLFVDEAEYKLLFGTEPPAGTPALAAAPASVINAPVQQSAEAPVVRRGMRGRQPVGPPQPAPRAAEPTDGTRFVPAGPAVEGLVSPESGPTEVSTRPVLTAADRGQWRLVEYVSDGNGLFTMKPRELLRYGLATGTISTNEELRAFFGATNLTRVEPSVWEASARFLANPIVKGVLIVVLIIGLFLEFTHPGMVLPGTVAALAIVALAGPTILLDLSSWWYLAAILVGIALLAMEVFVFPGFGVFGVLGMVSLFGGLLGTFMPAGSSLFPDSPEGQSSLLYGVTTLVISTSVSIVGMYFIGKHFGSLPLLNRLVLKNPEPSGETMAAVDPATLAAQVGQTGVAITPMRPAGRVQIGEALVDAVAEEGFIASGTPVKVVESSGMRVVVTATAPPTAGA
ncbi:MAG: hypothetical protein IOD15_07365 [Phycisphaerales bacterium]|jgi:membrane-bound ClpP family serine protease|nr:hypothetical protein [Phycisphaerales bacterium]